MIASILLSKVIASLIQAVVGNTKLRLENTPQKFLPYYEPGFQTVLTSSGDQQLIKVRGKGSLGVSVEFR